MESQKRDYEACSKSKEAMEQKLVECKSREEFFEERLTGFEMQVQSKDDIISKEKKEKEKIQDSMLKVKFIFYNEKFSIYCWNIFSNFLGETWI